MEVCLVGPPDAIPFLAVGALFAAVIGAAIGHRQIFEVNRESPTIIR